MTAMAFVAAAIALMIVFVVAKAMAANKQSKRDWERVDKSKLRDWDDEDDWPDRD